MNNWEIYNYVNHCSGTKALENLSTVNSAKIELGSSIVMTGIASGGTAPYEYAYYYKRSNATTWSKVKNKDFITDTTAKFEPLAAVVFDVEIKVRDATGEVVTKDFSINVIDSLSTDKVGDVADYDELIDERDVL